MIHFLPFLMGIVAVLQAGLNRKIAVGWGWTGATAMNATVLFLLAWAVYFSGAFGGRIQPADMKWWYVIPGIFGLSLVLGIPFAISRIGAMSSFLLIVVAQLISGGLWDILAEGQEFSWKKLIGGAVALLGTWIAVR